MALAFATISSPVGALTLAAGERGLRAILWENDRAGRVPLEGGAEDARHPVLRQAQAELAAYFAGRRRTFDVPLDLVGTPFQREVWAELLLIPYGETRSYRATAEAIGRPAASRAVGAAVGRNPISIVVPCHRVVGTSGVLTGFAGGLPAKRVLLDLEAGQATLAA